MNQKERNGIYRLSKLTKPSSVKNPADIKEKMKYYNESEIIGEKLSKILYEIHTPFREDDSVEKYIMELEEYFQKLKKQQGG